jgi:hypothetical protein
VAGHYFTALIDGELTRANFEKNQSMHLKSYSQDVYNPYRLKVKNDYNHSGYYISVSFCSISTSTLFIYYF